MDTFESIMKPIDSSAVKNASQILMKYRAGKRRLESKIVENEEFWKLRQWGSGEKGEKRTPATAWLWNVLVSKHADAMDSIPEPNILPREENDVAQAKLLSGVIPVILEQNDFSTTYSDAMWYKLKQGTGVYGVFWDSGKLNGLGDISVKKMDLLSCFWEPGVTDIQSSANFFTTQLQSNESLREDYPFLKDVNLTSNSPTVTKYRYDDTVDTTDKSLVIDWYYKKKRGTKTVVHYCKFVGDTVLFATENDPEHFPDGIYDHGKYPFVFDVLFPVEGSPCGYSYTDICKDTQIQIDELNAAMVKNAKIGSKVRYFSKMSGGINEDEFADWSNDIVHVEGDLDEKHVKPIEVPVLNGVYVNILNNKIDELKETSGNRDVNNGSTGSAVTAASAIAALQEASGKTSRDFLKNTYNAYSKIIKLVIGLIRQFYSEERKFRIIGEDGKMSFISCSNRMISGEKIFLDDGTEIGYRVPEFDVEVSAQKNTAYTKAAQNELALQFYNAGFFDPSRSDQAAAAVSMMDFSRKDSVLMKISQNSLANDRAEEYKALALTLAQIYEPEIAEKIMAEGNPGCVSSSAKKAEIPNSGESKRMQKARARARQTTTLD